MRKLFASVAVVTAVAVGGLAVAAVNPLAVVSARGEQAPTTSPAPAPEARQGRARTGVLDRALAKLVDEGTITAEQADAVRSAVQDGGKAARHRLQRVRRNVIETSAKAIGIPPDDLRAALKRGQSIAQVAQAHQIDPQKVIDALVGAGTAKVDEAVAAGKLKPERAAKIKERLPEASERIVNRVHTR